MIPLAAPTATSSFVTLGAGDEIFAVDVRYVREILDYCPISRLPYAPPFMVGVINVRGCTVPVVDLRLKLGLPAAPVSMDTRILVLELAVKGRELVVGLMVDKVFEVAEFEIASLDAAPDVGVRWKSEYIQAIGRLRDQFVIIFDMERLFGSEDVARLQGPS